MIGFLKSIDNKIIEAVQGAYLWLFDRTGIYVGTLMFALMTADMICWRYPQTFRPIDAVFLVILSTVAAGRYWMQGKGAEHLNALALHARELTIRKIFMALWPALIVMHVHDMQPWKVVSDLLCIVWQYLMVVLIRDREPKDFFEQRKLARSAT